MTVLYCALVVLFFAYYFFFFRRIHRTLGVDDKNHCVYAAECLGAMGLGAASVAALWLAVFGLHLIAVSLVVRFINFIVRRVGGTRYKRGARVWKKIYGCGIVPTVVALGIIIFGYVNMTSVTATRYTVYTDKAIRSEGYSVALIADVHFGVSLDLTELSAVCDEVSRERVDIVVLCGDIVDENTTKAQMRAVFKTLGGIGNRYGIFYVYGNHDRQLYSTESNYSEAELEQAIKDSGITVLRDEVFAVNDEFVIVGREDMSYNRVGDERKKISTLLADVDDADFILTLDHQPIEYEENGAAGTDLLLSGHTHGGQIWPMNILFKLTTSNDAVYGYTKIGAGSQAFVTAGLAGWGFPIKTSAPAEYVIINIKPK